MDTTSIVYITLEVLIAVASLLGNVLVLWAVAINRRLRTVTNLFIVSLATADLFVAVVAIPSAIASYNGLPKNNFYGCVFVNSIVILFTQSSVFSLLAIAIERFMAIKYPYAYETYFTSTNAIKLIIVTWLLSILIGLVPIMGWNLYPPTQTHCAFTDVIDMKFMVYFNFFLCILLPLVIMLGFYGYIFHIVRKQMRQIASLQLNRSKDRKERQIIKEIKAAKSLALILGFFAICWLPLHIMNSISLLCGDKCPQPYQLLLAAIILSHANSAFNPLLYAYCNTLFRLAFKDICLCRGWTRRAAHAATDDIFTVTRNDSNDFTNDNAVASADGIEIKNPLCKTGNTSLSLGIINGGKSLPDSSNSEEPEEASGNKKLVSTIVGQHNETFDMDNDSDGSVFDHHETNDTGITKVA
ncbi:adenosine receptor A2b-like [Liolophura sinensis]|uniref:adenosine receptor A2b-like n=1 Tax=Liolophura sinensis TaxID=3198878 RepID=UPI0031580A52